jgi:hypothetical protein
MAKGAGVARRASFWFAVAGVSVLSNFGLELLARKVPIPGLQQFVAFVHCGPGGNG